MPHLRYPSHMHVIWDVIGAEDADERNQFNIPAPS